MKKTVSTIASLILTCAFIGIMLFVMIVGLKVFDSDNGQAALIFTVIDFILIFLLVGLGRPFLSLFGVKLYAPICTAAILYAVFGFGATLLTFATLSFFLFTLLKLALLFLFVCIVIPLAVTGANSDKHSEDSRPEIRKHNLD